MKKTFAEYYAPTAAEFEGLLSSATIVLDTNILLDLYRSPAETTDELINVLNAARGQLWMPYQVGLEYHENVDAVIAEHRRGHSAVKPTIKKGLDDLRKATLEHRHPFIRASVLAHLDDLQSRLSADLDANWDISKLNERAISIRAKIEALFDDSKVGIPHSEQEITQICDEGKQRYENNVPPGFKDSRKPVSRRKYGDLILWKEVLAQAKKTKRPIVLVTDDAKEDWLLRVSGETIGPLPALRLEMLRDSGQRFHLYNGEQFLKVAAPVFLKRVASPLVIEDVERAGRLESLRGTVSVQIVRAAWRAIRDIIERQRQPLRAPLSRAQVDSVDGDTLILRVPDGWSASVLSDHVGVIEAAIAEVLGESLNLGIYVDSPGPRFANLDAAEDAEALWNYANERIRSGSNSD